jgi:hypothetical protein
MITNHLCRFFWRVRGWSIYTGVYVVVCTFYLMDFMYPAGQLKLIGSFFYVSRQHVNITARYKCTKRVMLLWPDNACRSHFRFSSEDWTSVRPRMKTYRYPTQLVLAANSHDSWAKLSIFRVFIMARSCVLSRATVSSQDLKLIFVLWCTIFNTLLIWSIHASSGACKNRWNFISAVLACNLLCTPAV